ncbi:YlbL family protein [Catenuloplanes japonicus]|uniref:YlbL family protein n=1 Tax=Catenuloplanes japonicus TaxID=33876 RepID=UPI000524D333|nr:PDZ domain-containing protein [Catenuloplanes japonicus]
MKRRGFTVLVGALITFVLTMAAVYAPIPYVILKPGPTVDTLGKDKDAEVIQISGTDVSSSAGQLRLTTVGVQPEPNLVSAILGWFDGTEAVVPRELIYPPDESEEQVDQRNAEEFQASQNSAETAALRKLGLPVHVTVEKVTDGGPSVGKLQVGDVITSVDGEPVGTAPRLTELVRAKPSGTERTVGVTRAGAALTVAITTQELEGQPRIGVEIAEKPPFTLEIKLDEIGGPSAGLMFTLGIIDKLKPEDLTGGKIIAGTGTIDADGNVGEIGGIPQKLVGAKRAGAEVFLVPEGNCAEAKQNAVDGLPMFKVATLDDALSALDALRAGRTPELC